MNIKIDSTWPKEKLDVFLRDNYGHGIAEFRLSLLYIRELYFYNQAIYMRRYCLKRIKEIDRIQGKFVELIDEHLSRINFYKTSIPDKTFEQESGISKWTSDKKRDFAIKYFRLKELLDIFTKQKELYEDKISSLKIEGSFTGLDESMLKMKPINMLVLVWAHVMKRGKKIDWINMELLLNWFSKNTKQKVLLEFFLLNVRSDFDTEFLRLTYNKYRNTKKYRTISYRIFHLTFQGDEYDIEIDNPIIEKHIMRLHVGKKEISIKDWINYIDLITCLDSLEIKSGAQDVRASLFEISQKY